MAQSASAHWYERIENLSMRVFIETSAKGAVSLLSLGQRPGFE
jgi:hypothetical protein